MDHAEYRQALGNLVAGSECPFPRQEFDTRQLAVERALAESGLDALLLTDPSDIYYLTGYSTFEVSVHTALLLAPGVRALQVPSIETGPAVACTRLDDIIGYHWECPEEIIGPLAKAISRCGPRVGIDPWHGSLRHGVVSALSKTLPELRLNDAAPIMDRIRRVKSPIELDCLAESARITAIGIESAAKMVSPGITDSEIAARGAEALLAAGSEFMSMQPIVSSGRRISIIHTSHRRHRVAAGEPVFLEFGAAWQRYTAPMMRTVVAGRPTKRMQQVFDTCRTMFDALLETMRPDRCFDHAARAAQQALAPLSRDVFFSGVFGYSVGAQFPPSWVEGSGFIARGQMADFEENMVFHLPLCLRIPGLWGIGVSDTVRVTATGAEPITSNPWTLAIRGE